MKKFLLLVTLICVGIGGVYSQQMKPWFGKQCAVVLTYDDAIDQHLDNAIPVLDSLGLKATFYLSAFSSSMQNRMDAWKKLAVKGHELGNHTLYHPCAGGPGREWVRKEYDLNTYTVKRIEDEIRMTNLFLNSLDGKKERSFAFTCGEMKVGDSSFMDGLKKDFVAARAVRKQIHTIDQVDLYNVDCYAVNGETGEQLIEWVKKAQQSGGLLVILFHGVGGGNALNVSVEAHRTFLRYLKQHENEIWVTPMITAAKYIQEWQKGHH